MTSSIPVILIACLWPAMTVQVHPSARQASGIEGYVFLVSGNRMPSPGKTLPRPKGAKTTLYLYQITNLSQVSRQGETSFYTALGTHLIRQITTDTSGYFKALVAPGEYSLFVKKEDLFYANSFDDKNNINPVRVSPHLISQINFNIDYDASY